MGLLVCMSGIFHIYQAMLSCFFFNFLSISISKQWDDSAAKEMEECCDASITSTNVEAMSIGNVTFLYLE